MTPRAHRHQRGLTLLEILVAMFLLATVALASGAVIRALGFLGVVRFSGTRYERPARLRTIALEYVQAELEYLRHRPYEFFRDDFGGNPACDIPFPTIHPQARRVPASYLDSAEPRLPAFFSAADIVISSESVVSPSAPPNDCRPRRITVRVFYLPGEVPGAVGGSGGDIFLRGETAVAPR